GGDFLFYHEGMTSAIGKAVEALDRERLSLGKALGLSNMRSLRDQDIAWYGHQGVFGNNVHETSVNNPIYRWSKAPSILDHRYLTEDVPYGLVPVESLGRWAKVKTTVTSALIDLACVVLERDLRAAGRTLERLGLSFATLEELRRVVDESGV
ncbi:MAG: NAD/NADP octopine/nopaline dehydrogenase family protein, partial [Bacillota bacterium]